MVPGRTFHGRATFEWLEGGAFLAARMYIDEPEIPDGTAVFGTDDARPDAGTMLYFDDRRVSREYHWAIAGRTWTWSRDEPGFSQRMQFTISEDANGIVSRGELSRDGSTWEPDLQLTYTRRR